MDERAPQPAAVHLTVNGRPVTVRSPASLVEALLALGPARQGGAGCQGQGVCGSCRALVRRPDSADVALELGCETVAEAGMQVTFLDDLVTESRHRYQLDPGADTWAAASRVLDVFPEAVDCRHCGGCDRACPKGIEVEAAVAHAVEGRLSASAAAFDDCVMCDLCTVTCPESIAPNHLGLFVRRLLNSSGLRPDDLLLRLHQIQRGQMVVDAAAPVAGEPAGTSPS
jgi:ferredoxin